MLSLGVCLVMWCFSGCLGWFVWLVVCGWICLLFGDDLIV